jgi:hypothetical protein
MLRFKQYIIETFLILEDKATDFANRYMKVHANHPAVKENPESAREILKQAMAYSQGSDESDYLTKQFLDGVLKPGEDASTIQNSLGKWRKAVQRGFTKGKKLSDFGHDDLQRFFSNYPELNVSKRIAKATTAFDPFHIGDIDLPEKVITVDKGGITKFLEPGTKVKVHHYSDMSQVTSEQRKAFHTGMRKSCPPGSSWCVLNDPAYLENYSKGSGFFLYTDEAGIPVFAHGFGDRGVVDPNNSVLPSTKKIMQKTTEVMPEGNKKVLHKALSGLDISPEEIKSLSIDPDPEMRMGVLKGKSIPEEAADALLVDKDPWVQTNYFDSKHLRTRHLEPLSQSSDPNKRAVAARKAHGLSDETFEKLIKDPVHEVRSGAANSGIGRDALGKRKELISPNSYRTFDDKDIARLQKVVEHEKAIGEHILSPTTVEDFFFDPMNAMEKSIPYPYSVTPAQKELQLEFLRQKRLFSSSGVVSRSPDIDIVREALKQINPNASEELKSSFGKHLSMNKNFTEEQLEDLRSMFIQNKQSVTPSTPDVSPKSEVKSTIPETQRPSIAPAEVKPTAVATEITQDAEKVSMRGKQVSGKVAQLADTAAENSALTKTSKAVGIPGKVAKAVPFVGAVLSAPDAIRRAKEGDYVGAVGTMASNFDPTGAIPWAMHTKDTLEDRAKQATTLQRSTQGGTDALEDWFARPFMDSSMTGKGSNVRQVIQSGDVSPAREKYSDVVVAGSVKAPTKTVPASIQVTIDQAKEMVNPSSSATPTAARDALQATKAAELDREKRIRSDTTNWMRGMKQ